MTTEELLRLAVERGLISEAQRDDVLRLDATAAPVAREAPRGFNWVTVAYVLGAFLVVFAGGWFLAQRWLALGPAGVLLITAAYAAVAGLSSRWLLSHGFPEAAGVAAMVAVSLTPVAAWALESLTGWWPVETWGQPYYPEFPAAEASRWVVAELATILAALLVLRRQRYSALGFPVAAALFGLVNHVPRSVGAAVDLFPAPMTERWLFLTGALLVCAIADTVDRRVPRGSGRGRGDLAFPIWVVGLVALGASILSFWPTAGAWRHALPVLALGAVVLSLTMGRRSHLVFGVLSLFLYLMYLAAEVFRSTAYFPVVLAALGGALLFATVWAQRRFPALAQRLGARAEGRGGLPGSPVMPWLVAVAALGITILRMPEAAEERANLEFQQRLHVLRMHSGSLRAAPGRRGPERPAPGPAEPRPEPPPA